MAYRLDELAVELTVCPYCLAVRRVRCTVVKGRTAGTRASYTHSGRTDAIYAGWRDGYIEGAGDALDQLERLIAGDAHPATELVTLEAVRRHADRVRRQYA